MIDLQQSLTAALELLRARLAEPPPGRIQIIVGPRQVGKTTMLLALADELGDRATYIAADEAAAAAAGFWEQVFTRVEARASAGPQVLLIDEVHGFSDWAARLKPVWDRWRRRKTPIHLVLTGSSALKLGSGSKESLAGRFERLEVSHWSAADLAKTFGLTPTEAADVLVRYGGYPGAMMYRGDRRRWRAYVRDAIIEPAISRDLLLLHRVQKPALLRQVFAVATMSPAAIVTLQKLQGQMQDRGALETLRHYLELLQESYLVAMIPKLSATELRRRAAPPKLVTLDNALLTAMHPDDAPDTTHDPARFGRWVENACLAHGVHAGQSLAYWREENLEVDAVTEGSWGKWAIEVKVGPYRLAELKGLLAFKRRHPEHQLLVVGDEEHAGVAERAGIATAPWRDFLLSGPPGA